MLKKGIAYIKLKENALLQEHDGKSINKNPQNLKLKLKQSTKYKK